MSAITEYTASGQYNNGLLAQAYYKRQNPPILRRRDAVLSTGELSKSGRPATKPVNRKCCGFFAKSVNQLAMYLLGNGVTLEQGVKARLGAGFDTTLQRIGRQALIDGVCWGYWEYDRLRPLKAQEFFALPDERTGEYMVGIRFYRLDAKKPRYIEVFEADGVTVYREWDNALSVEAPKRPYMVCNYISRLAEVNVGGRNYGRLPVVPFWANDFHESLLTEGLRNDIDLYDRIMSDFGDNLDRANDIYYVVQNYGGANLKQLMDEIEEYRAIYTDGDSGAKIQTLDVPYKARAAALRLLERQMYKETQTLDTEELTGGGLTNVAIKAAMTELDLKADMLEWQAEAFVREVLELALSGEAAEAAEAARSVAFHRRSLMNDAEMINNIYTMRGDIDLRTALELNPLIGEGKVDEIIRRLADS